MKILTLLLSSIFIVSCNARLTSSIENQKSLSAISSSLSSLEQDLSSINMSSVEIDNSISKIFIEKMNANNKKADDQKKSEQDIRVEAETEVLEQTKEKILNIAAKNGVAIEELELSLCEDGTISYDRIKFDDEACTEFDLSTHPINNLETDAATKTEYLANILTAKPYASTRSEISACKRNLTKVKSEISHIINYKKIEEAINSQTKKSVCSGTACDYTLSVVKLRILEVNKKYDGNLINIEIIKTGDAANNDLLEITSIDDGSGPVAVPASTQQEVIDTITEHMLDTDAIECK